MELKVENDKVICSWTYQINKKEKEVDGRKYQHYVTSFPSELVHLWDVEYVFVSESDDVDFSVEVAPFPLEDAKKIRLSKVGKYGFTFALPKRMLSSLDEKSFVNFCFDGRSCLLRCF